MSRFLSRLSHLGHKRDKSTDTLRADGSATPVVNSRPDLVTTEDEEANSSHPSEHNAYFGNPSDKIAQVNIAYREKQSHKCVESARKGREKDPWRGLQAERAERNQIALLDGTEDDGRARHREAFTDPYYGYGYYYPYWGVNASVPYG
jgi:hypothetical protein